MTTPKWERLNEMQAHSLETLYQNGGTPVYISEHGATYQSHQSAAREFRSAPEGVKVYARRKIGGRYTWVRATKGQP